MSNKGTLFLIPNLISGSSDLNVLSPQIQQVLPEIRHFLAEDLRAARRYLSRLRIFPAIEELNFSPLNKDTGIAEIGELCKPLLDGHHMGVISESGCPGIADPGALAVSFAHDKGVRVVPLVGPSSVLLALMASGLNGQRFAFHGYLPIDSAEAGKTIRMLEKESRGREETQIFIETPYRNNAVFGHLIRNLSEGTRLCVAVDLTGRSENISTKTVKVWRAQTIELPKDPAIFLFLA